MWQQLYILSAFSSVAILFTMVARLWFSLRVNREINRECPLAAVPATVISKLLANTTGLCKEALNKSFWRKAESSKR